MSDIRTQAAILRARGYTLCRIQPGRKTPGYAGWSTRSIEPDEFREGESIGIVCGPFSPELSLVCVDLDAAPAIEQADAHLPGTSMREGRPGKPLSHRYYAIRNASIPVAFLSKAEQAAPAAQQRFGTPGPRTIHGFRIPGVGNALDVQGTGGIAVCAPSVHASGERRVWEGGEPGQPAELDFAELMDAVRALAAAIGCAVPHLGYDDPGEAEPCEETWHVAIHQDAAEAAYADALRALVRREGLPRTGEKGDSRTFAMLALGLDHGLTADRVLAVFEREVNTPLVDLRDAWSKEELSRKLDTLLSRGPRSLPVEPAERGVALRWDDARRLAGSLPECDAIRFKGDTAWMWDGRRYAELTAGCGVKDLMRQHAERAAEREWRDAIQRRADLVALLEHEIAGFEKSIGATQDAAELKTLREGKRKAEEQLKGMKPAPKAAPPVTSAMVANAVESLRAMRALPQGTAFNTYLTDGKQYPWLACENGIYDHELCTLLPHDRGWFSPVVIPVRYDRNALAPEEWVSFIDRVTSGDAQLAAVLQEVVGSCLDPNLNVQFFAMLVGEGRNGKSAFLAALRALLGTANCSAVDLASLTGHRFMAYQMLGKLCNLCADQSYFDADDVSMLKKLTGGDLVAFEQKGKQPIEAVCTAKIIVACNELPRLRDRSEGVWRRAVLIPFNWRVPQGEADPRMTKVEYWQQGKLPGMLNWALQGLARLRQRGEFDLPPACVELLREHRLDSNPARRFLEEHYRQGEGFVVAAEVYQAYRVWADGEGLKRDHILGAAVFGKEVARAFPGAESVTRKTGGAKKRVWQGVVKLSGVLSVVGSEAAERQEREGTAGPGDAVPGEIQTEVPSAAGLMAGRW